MQNNSDKFVEIIKIGSDIQLAVRLVDFVLDKTPLAL